MLLVWAFMLNPRRYRFMIKKKGTEKARISRRRISVFTKNRVRLEAVAFDFILSFVAPSYIRLQTAAALPFPPTFCRLNISVMEKGKGLRARQGRPKQLVKKGKGLIAGQEQPKQHVEETGKSLIAGQEQPKHFVETGKSLIAGQEQPKQLVETGKSLVAGKKQPKQLVICFTPLSSKSTSMYYSFESFPVLRLIGKTLKQKSLGEPSCKEFTTEEEEKPEDKFVWQDKGYRPKSNLCNPLYYGLSFLHVGGGKVYVVGGVVREQLSSVRTKTKAHVPPLNNDFRRISLATPLESSTLVRKRSMAGKKYYPLIAEMDGLIYVLSAPPDNHYVHSNESPFEVYNPRKDKWCTLKSPPFIDTFMGSCVFQMTGYAHVVIGGKLCVSNSECSSMFDPLEGEWKPCHIFSECELIKRMYLRVPWLSKTGLCGPPFPFWKRPIYYREDILLCACIENEEYGVLAFKIKKVDDGEKAMQMQVHFDDFPIYSWVIHLVDLGDDYVCALIYETDEHYGRSKQLTIVTFKVSLEMGASEEGEVLAFKLVYTTHSNVVRKPGEGWFEPVYCFTM